MLETNILVAEMYGYTNWKPLGLNFVGARNFKHTIKILLFLPLSLSLRLSRDLGVCNTLFFELAVLFDQTYRDHNEWKRSLYCCHE